MERLLLSMLLVFVFYSCSKGQEVQQSQTMKLVWSDEFEYSGLPDDSKWDYEAGFVRNEEAQYYTKAREENVKVEDGCLVITGRKEKYKNPGYVKGSPKWQLNREYAEYTSGSVITKDRLSVRYGRVEVKAKLSFGKGTWPAIWMLGDNISQIGWPKCGEIDIMEFLGRESHRIYGTCHWGEENTGKHRSDGKHIDVTPVPSDDFHIYAINWYPDRIEFFYDDLNYYTFEIGQAGENDDNAFRKPFYLLINLALGGWGGEIDDSIIPQNYYIDYVRVYEFQ